MLERVLSRNVWLPVLGVTCLELFSYLATFYPAMNSVFFLIIVIIFARIAWKDQATALGLVVLELCIGSKGYLFALTAGSTVISIRYALFAVILLIWAIKNYRHDFRLYELMKDHTFIFYIFFLAALALGTLNGMISGYPFSNIFTDLNGYLYLLLAPIFILTLKDKESAEKILFFAFVGIIYLSFKTFFAHVVFSHLTPLLTFTLYKWIRLSGVGEITRVHPDFDVFRVFFQSQVWMVGLFPIFVFSCFNDNQNTKTRNKTILLLTGIICSLIVSFSRSFWVGVVVGGVLCLGYLIAQLRRKKLTMPAFVSGLSQGAKSGLLALILLILGALLPLPNSARLGPKIFTSRASTGDAASSSRTEQLVPLLAKIKEAPWLGSGFGTTVSYKSFDPRNSSKLDSKGLFTTSAFEWGYLDTITEIGILGLLVFTVLLLSITMKLVRKFKSESDYTYLGLALGIISISAVSIFSPYWNHPLGLGFLMFAWGVAGTSNN